MTEDRLEALFDKRDAFAKDFKKLVLKYAGKDFDKADEQLLLMMQEQTSCFSPYIWDGEDD